jgi:hypothetical protein
MRAAGEIRLGNSRLKNLDTDMLIMLSYAIFAIAFLALIYAASAPGTAAGDFASMSAFP